MRAYRDKSMETMMIGKLTAGATALALPAFQGWAFLDDGIFAAALRAGITL